jgi:CheY-like chemotaxis protein
MIQIRPYMGLIMYTVRVDVGLAHSLQALGVTYLTKPASRAGLGEAVRDASSKSARINIEGPTRLLIAEDTPAVRDVLSRQLQKIGVEADFAPDGQAALEAVQSGRYGILITDLHMPHIDGYQLVEKIRQRETNTGQHFPVIVLTADVQMAQRETYLRHGFDECLLKPVSLGQFKRLLIRWGLLSQETHAELEPEKKSALSPERASPQKPAIDREAMVAQMGAFDQNAIEMLGMFVEMTEPLIDRIKTAHLHKDYHDLAEAAHSLKGAARSACCNALGDAASVLQDEGEKNRAGEVVVQNVCAEFERARIEIQKLRSQDAA